MKVFTLPAMPASENYSHTAISIDGLAYDAGAKISAGLIAGIMMSNDDVLSYRGGRIG